MTPIDAHKEIQGWLSDKEAQALQLVCDKLHVVEVGCWKAKSSIAMAATAKTVLTVDHFRGDPYTGSAFTLPEAIENIRNYDTDGKVTVLIQDFFAIEDGPIKEVLLKADVLYYDGDHSVESVKKLVRFAQGYAAMPIIAFHDYENSPVYQEGKDVFDSFVNLLIDSGFDSDCLIVVERLAIVVPPRFRSKASQLEQLR